MSLTPKKLKYAKHFRGKLSGKTSKGHNFIYGNYGIKSCEETHITSKQLESSRQAVRRAMKKNGQLFIRIFPDTPVTNKPNEVRMGKGKGAVREYVAKVKKGQLIFEINGLAPSNAFKVLTSGQKKLPIKTRAIKKFWPF